MSILEKAITKVTRVNDQREATDHTPELVVAPRPYRRIGEILKNQKKLTDENIEHIATSQDKEGLYFGEAAIKLRLVSPEDVQYALSCQFGYPYLRLNDGGISKELSVAYEPFGEQAENYRVIRSQLLLNYLNKGDRSLAIVSPRKGDGRSYVAANLALVFAQCGKKTLLIDADFRGPRQHRIFNFTCRIGMSTILAGGMSKENMGHVPENIPVFDSLSVLAAGLIPPNPAELFSNGRFSLMLRELRRHFDIIIIDTPAGKYRADVEAICSAAGSALMVVRKDYTPISEAKNLTTSLSHANVKVVGSILN